MLLSLLVTLRATVRVPRFRAVLVRLRLAVPVLGRLRTGIRLTADRGLSGVPGTAVRLTPGGRLTPDGRLSDVLRTGIGSVAHWRLSGIGLARVRLTSRGRLRPGNLWPWVR